MDFKAFITMFDSVWVLLKPVLKLALILIVGHLVAVYLAKWVGKRCAKAKMDPSLIKFVDKSLNVVLHLVIILAALSAIGISTTGIVAVMSAAGAAIAIALKDSLSNVAGGILLLLAPRFSTGDYIEAGGDSGTVLNIDLFHTLLLTPDKRQVSVPNGALVNSHIINYSHEPIRRLDLVFSISYESDVEKAKAVALETIKSHPLTDASAGEPFARISGYGDSAVQLTTRIWCKNEDYWTLHFDLTEQIRVAFDKNGIGIPFNQLDVRIKSEPKA